MTPERVIIETPYLLVNRSPESRTLEDFCGTGYHEDGNNSTSPELQAAVDRLDDHSVDARVYVTTTLGQDGFADIYEFADSVTEECGLGRHNELTVYVATDSAGRFVDATLDAYDSQDTFYQQNPDEFGVITDRLGDDLRVPGNIQEDAATAFAGFYEAQFTEDETPAPVPVVTLAPAPVPVEVQSPKETGGGIEAPDLSTVLIAGGGLLTLATAGAVAFDTISKNKIKADIADFEAKTKQNAELATDTYYMLLTEEQAETAFDKETAKNIEIDSDFATIAEGDAPNLIALSKEVIAGYQNWKAHKDGAKTRMAAAKKGFRGDRSEVRLAKNDYMKASNDYIETVQAFNAELAKYKEKKAAIAGLSVGVMEALTSTIEQISALKQPDKDGGEVIDTNRQEERYYDVSSLESQLQEISSAVTLSNQKKDEFMFDSAYDGLFAAKKRLAELKAFAENIPTFHDGLVVLSTDKQTMSKNMGEALQELQAALSYIKDNYDESCYLGLDNEIANATAMHGTVVQKLAELGDVSALRDIAKLQEAQTLLQSLESNENSFSEAEQQINRQKKTLDILRENMPEIALQLEGAQADAETFTRANADTVDDENEAVVYSLKEEVTQLRRELADDKPKYIDLKQAADNLDKKIKNARAHAEADHQEIVGLEGDVQRLAAEFEKLVDYAVSYEASHSDVDDATERDVEGLDDIQLPKSPTARSRVLLRRTKEAWTKAIDIVQEVVEDEKQDVQREEGIRAEQLRLAEAARLEAERLERQARQERQRAMEAATRISLGGGSHHGGHHKL